jgi:hypothetical protein
LGGNIKEIVSAVLTVLKNHPVAISKYPSLITMVAKIMACPAFYT